MADDMEIEDLFADDDDVDAPGAPKWLTRKDEIRRSREVEMKLSDVDHWHPASEHAAKLLTHWLADKKVSEIRGNGMDKFFMVREGATMQIDAAFNAVEEYNEFLRNWIDIAETPRTWSDLVSERSAVVKMHDGSSLTLIFPPMARTGGKGAQFVVRKHNMASTPLEAYGHSGTFSPQMFEYLKACVRASANILIVGPMGSGKTSLMSALTEMFSPDQRVLLAEEVPEIAVRQPDVAYLQYHPDEPFMSLNHALDKALYMRADRVIVGEMHKEGLTLTLEAFMRGTEGGMFTYHAGTIDQALDRLSVGLLMENENMQLRTTTMMVQQAVDVIVVLARKTVPRPDGEGFHRIYRCRQIAELDWRTTQDGELGRKIYWEWDPATDTFKNKDSFDPKGKVAEKASDVGVHLDPNWFLNKDRLGDLGRNI
jgi:type IV secretory pathway ATPase VirB11/archaellum biosynthesis ATPase